MYDISNINAKMLVSGS